MAESVGFEPTDPLNSEIWRKEGDLNSQRAVNPVPIFKTGAVPLSHPSTLNPYHI